MAIIMLVSCHNSQDIAYCSCKAFCLATHVCLCLLGRERARGRKIEGDYGGEQQKDPGGAKEIGWSCSSSRKDEVSSVVAMFLCCY